MPVAGIPSVRTDLPRPIVPPKGCRADLDHLGDDTSAKALISPSIFTAYGLNYRDFYMVNIIIFYNQYILQIFVKSTVHFTKCHHNNNIIV